MAELSPRKQQILRAVVVEYVAAAEPVSSDLIAQRYSLGVRGATIRNELLELTEAGVLEQPHTSAGRVPSDLGYRYFVDHLMVRQDPQSGDRSLISDAASEEDTLAEILRETTKLLSRMTHLLSAASILRDAQLPVRNVIVTALGPDRALLVVVLQNGQVENRYVECPPGTTLQHIGQANEALATACQGTTLRGLAKLKTPAHEDPVLAKFLRACAASLRNLGRDLTRGRLITEGEEYVMAQPEFARDASAMKALLAGIEDEEALHAAVAGDGVTIGREHAEERLHPLTIIRRTFTVGEDEAGSIAIVGPTRLQYERATGLLDFTASAVSQTLTKLLK